MENEESNLTVRNQTLHLTAQQEESSTLTDHPFGSKVPISAIPRDGYYFDTWLGEGVSDPSAKNTFAVMTEDRNITALFKPHSFNLEVELTFGGEILGEGTYLFEETAELVAIEKSGYKFEGWYDQGIQISDEASFELIIKEDISLIAKFISTFHKVELDASLGGEVLGGGSFAEGTEIHIQALPDDGFIFDYWEGVPDSLSQLPSAQLIVANDLIIKANFVAKPSGLHTLSIQSIPAQGGKHVGSGAYEIGDEIEISALELPGYVFEKWIGDGVIDPSQATTTVKISGDHSILAQFSPLDHNLEIISGEGGVALGGGSYSYGNTVNISAVPAVGYRFLYWDGMGIIEPFKKSTQIIITDDMTIQPKFALQEHTLTIDTSTGGLCLGKKENTTMVKR